MRKLSGAFVAVSLVFGSLAQPILAESANSVPVMLVPDTDHGTCSIGLRVNAGGAVVRSGPSPDFPVVATLEAGHIVAGCAEQNGWDGIIDGLDETCSVGIMVATTRPYDGPCISGWIEQSALTSIYG